MLKVDTDVAVGRALLALLITLFALFAVPANASAAPPNDDFAAATVLTGPQQTVTGTSAGATVGPGETGDPAIWFRHTPTQSGWNTVSVCMSWDVSARVHTGSDPNALQRVTRRVDYDDCSGGTLTSIGFQAQAGTAYSIEIAPWEPGPYTLSLNPPPLNDLRARARAFSGDVATGSTRFATREAGEPPHAGDGTGGSVWFDYTAPLSGRVTLDTCESDFDARLAIYRGAATTPVAASAAGACAPVTLDVTRGAHYLIALAGRSGASGTYVLRGPPANDARKRPGELYLGDALTVSNARATAEPGEPAHAGRPARASLWYELLLAQDQPVTIETCGSALDTQLAVYAEGEGMVASSDDAPACGAGSTASRVTFVAKRHVEYRLAVDARTSGDVRLAVAPANDRFSYAAKITPTDSPFYGDTTGAVREEGEPTLGGGSVWYRAIATASGPVMVDTCTPFEDPDERTTLGVYTGASLNALLPVATATPCGLGGTGARVTFNAVAGTVYHLAVASVDGATGSFVLRIAPPMSNDAFANATPLSTYASGTTQDATREAGEPQHAGQPGGASVWYRLPSAAGQLIVCTGFDALIGVYRGTALAALEPVASGTANATGCASIDPAGGTHLAIDGRDGARGSFSVQAIARPANDDFQAASSFTGYAYFDTRAATAQAGEPAHSGVPATRSVWFTHTATSTRRVVLHTCDSYSVDTTLAVYRGSALEALTPVNANDDAPGCGSDGRTSRVVLDLAAGETYRIAVDVKGGGGFVYLALAERPYNDDFSGSETLYANATRFTTIDGATVQAGEPPHAGKPRAASLWYRFTPTRSGNVVFDTCGSGVDAAVAVYAGDELSALTPLAADDAACELGGRVTILGQAGVTYRIAVAVDAGVSGRTRIFVGTAPDNDAFADAQTLTSVGDSITGSIDRATREPGEPGTGVSVWYRITPARDGRATIALCDPDLGVAVYTGAQLSALTPVGTAEPCANGAGTTVSFDATAGTIYRIAVTGDTGTTGSFDLDAYLRPPHDDFATPATFVSNTAGDTTYATRESGEPRHADQEDGGSLWYRYVATRAATLRLDTCGSALDTVLAVYAGTALDALTPVAASDDGCGTGSRVVVPVRAGDELRIAVDGYGGERGAFALRATLSPLNDDVSVPLGLGTRPSYYSGTTTYATSEPGEPAHAGLPADASVWFSFTPTATAGMSIDTCSYAEFDTRLAVYTGAPGALTAVAANDDAAGCASGQGARVFFRAEAGVTYLVAVDGERGADGYFSMQFQYAPSNDAFAAATPLAATPQLTNSGTTVAASTEPGEPAHGGGGNSVWYSWTPAVTRRVTLATCALGGDSVVTAYTGAAVDALTPVAADAARGCPSGIGSRLAFTATAGTTYRIAVDSRGGPASFTLTFLYNDDFADAERVMVGTSSTSMIATAHAATLQMDEPEHAGAPRSIWYALTSTRTAAVTIDTCSADADLVLDVYTGTALTALTRIGRGDDVCGTSGISPRVTVELTAGETYYVALSYKNTSTSATVYLSFPIYFSVAPSNDRFADAQVLDPTWPYSQSPTLTGASRELDEPLHANVVSHGSVWYTLTLPRTARVALDLCASGSTDTVVAVYTGASVSALTPIASNDDDPVRCTTNPKGSRVEFEAQAGNTYRIAVASKNPQGGYAAMSVSVAPEHDAFVSARELPFGSDSASNVLATREPGEPDHAGVPGGGSLWWVYTPTTTGRVMLDTCSGTLDTLLAIYTGPSVSQLTPVISDDDSCGKGSRVEFTATAGTAYRIAVDGKQGARGTVSLRIASKPINDDFSGATELWNASTDVAVSTRASGVEAGEPAHAGIAGGRSVWYRLRLNRAVPVTLRMCASDFAPLLAVYTGTRVDAITPVVSDDGDAGCSAGSGAHVTFTAAVDTTYWIAIDGRQGSFGDGTLSVRIPPVNDDFQNAQTLGSGTYYLDLRGATKQPGEPAHAGRTGGTSLWYRYTPTASGPVTIEMCVWADTLLAVYTGSDVAALTLVAANDDTPGCGNGQGSRVTIPAEAGKTYRIAVDDKAAMGNVYGSLTLSRQPANDAFTAADPLTAQRPVAYGTVLGATKETGEPAHAGVQASRSVWYSWTAEQSGTVTLDTCASGVYGDSLLGVYTGSSVSALTFVAGNDDMGAACSHNPDASAVTFSAQAGTTYRIAVDVALNASYSTFVLTLGLPPANDAFTDAQALMGAAAQVWTTNRRATVEIGEPGHGSGASLWFKWTAPTTGTATIDTCGSGMDTAFGVYRGAAIGSLTRESGPDSTCYRGRRTTIATTAGTEYRIAVGGVGATTGTIRLAINAPSHDTVDQAEFIAGATVRTTSSNDGAGLELFETTHAGDRGGASVWYRWTAPRSGPVELDTCGSEFDTLLDAYLGSGSFSGLLLEGFNDDSVECGAGSKASKLRFDATGGSSYVFAVDGKQGATGMLKLFLQLGVDTTPPQTSVLAGPASLSNDGTPTFTFGADEPADFECALGEAAFSACATPSTFGPLADGQYTLRVRARDRAGNVDETPATWAFRIDTVAPETDLSSPPARTRLTRVPVSFTSEPGARFECRVDSGAWTSCVSTFTTPTLAEGPHSVQVRAIDGAGNIDASPAVATFTVDTTAPVTTKVSGPGAVSPTSSVTFTWEANESATYQCSLNGAQFADCTTPRTVANLADDDHTFRVRATDDVGNVQTTPLEWAFAVEATPPETTITEAPSAFVRSADVTLRFSSSERGTFECRLDGAEPFTCTSPHTFANVPEGEHLAIVRAIDRAGNPDPTPASASFTVDRTPPQTTIANGPGDLTRDNRPLFAFTADEPGTFECALDDAAFSPCAAAFRPSSVTDGEHTLRVRALDRAGNPDASPATHTFTVDTRAPETTASGGETTVTTPSATFALDADEPGSTFECALDTTTFTACTSPYTTPALVDGEHTLRVRATDRAGNTDPTPFARTFRVEARPPETTLLTTPRALGNDTAARFTFASSEPGSTFECVLDDAPAAPCVTPATFAVGEGEHRFRVHAIDPFGRHDPTPAEFTFTVDLTPPETTITSAPPALTNDATPLFAFEAGGETGASYECALDGGTWRPCGPAYRLAAIADGEHTLRVRALDRAGNADPSPASHTFTVDTVAPETTLESGPAALIKTKSATIAFASPESGVTFRCTVGGTIAPCTAPLVLTDLADRDHTVVVAAVDPAGNVDATPVRVTFRVDTTPPQTSIQSGPSGLVRTSDVSFAFAADESGSSFECSLDGAAFSACSSPRALTLADGQHVFAVRAIDAAGHTDLSPEQRAFTVNTEPLAADAGGAQRVQVEEAMTFDGGGSRPAPLIAAYTWDFGDGTPATSGARVTHAYSAPGTYTAKLTVRTAAGETATSSAEVVILPPARKPGLRVHVTGSGGRDLANASLMIVHPDGGQQRVGTDARGVATLTGLADGGVTVYAWATGYRPAAHPATVTAGEGDLEVALVAGEAGAATLDQRRMSREELAAAGLDFGDPSNYHVYEADIHLYFGEEGKEFKVYVTPKGVFCASVCPPSPSGGGVGPGGGGGPGTGGGGGCLEQVRRPCWSDGSSQYLPEVTYVEGEPVVHWLVLPMRASWLKEFFSVQLVVQNLTSGLDFAPGTATLSLPQGLSLAPLAQAQTLEQSVPTVPSGASRTTTWVVRGDTEGMYDLSAVYSSTVAPIDLPVKLLGRTATPLKVWGASALRMRILADRDGRRWAPYGVDIEITNVSDIPIYNLQVEMLDKPDDAPAGQADFFYAPHTPQVQGKETLAPGRVLGSGEIEPGETWTSHYVVYAGIGNSEVENLKLLLEKSFVRRTGGDVDLDPEIAYRDGPSLGNAAEPVAAKINDAGDEVRVSWRPGDVPAGRRVTGYELYTRQALRGGEWTRYEGDIDELLDVHYATIPAEQRSLGRYYAVVTKLDDGSLQSLHQIGVGPARYVSLGDSFSSGEGVPAFEPGTAKDVTPTGEDGDNLCHRSWQGSYGRRLVADRSVPSNLTPAAFHACSGAVTRDVEKENAENKGEVAQKDHVNRFTDVISLSMGGNDAGFKDLAALCILIDCVKAIEFNELVGSNAWLDKASTMWDTGSFFYKNMTEIADFVVTCANPLPLSLPAKLSCGYKATKAIKAAEELGEYDAERIATPRNIYNQTLRNRLVRVYKTLLQRAPDATLFVQLYPQMVETSNHDSMCQLLGPSFPLSLSGGERSALRELTVRLNQEIQLAVYQADRELGGAQRVRAVDPTPEFEGHELCRDGELNPGTYFNSVVNPYVSTPGNYGPLSYSVHPNAGGQKAYALALARVLKHGIANGTVHVRPRETSSAGKVFVPYGARFVRAETSWPGSTVKLSLVSPSGVVYDARTPGVRHAATATTESLEIDDPAPGEWEVRLFGEDVAEGGEPTTVTATADLPEAEPLPITLRQTETGRRTFALEAVGGPANAEYRWTFSDGSSDEGRSVGHTFTGTDAMWAKVQVIPAGGGLEVFASAELTPAADSVAPVIAGVPADSTAEATGPDGRTVAYAAPTAEDAVDGTVPVHCLPASGTVFALGVTTVSCAAHDAAENEARVSFKVTVRDTTAPSIAVADDLRVPSTSRTGATVTYTPPAATDIVSGPVAVSCAPASGTGFAIGATTVTCTARDESGNEGTATFSVTVTDSNRAPTLAAVPDVVLDAGATTRVPLSAADPDGDAVTFSVSGVPAFIVLRDGRLDITAPRETGRYGPYQLVASDGLREAHTVFWVVVRDVTAPALEITTPREGAAFSQGQTVVAGYRCVDEAGGSGMAICSGNVADGAALDTSTPGEKTFTVTGRDGAGNEATLTRRYTVTAVNPGPPGDPGRGAGPVPTVTPTPTPKPAVPAAVRLGRVKLARNGRSVTVALTCGTGSGRCAGKLELRSGKRVVGKASYRIGTSRAATVTVKLSKTLPKKAKLTLKVSPTGAKAFSRKLKL